MSDPGFHSMVGYILLAGFGLLMLYGIVKIVRITRSMSRDDDIPIIDLENYNPDDPYGDETDSSNTA